MSLLIPPFNPLVNTIHVDMDGVVADFDRLVFERMGRKFDHVSGPGADREMWDFLQTIDRLYYNLEPTPYAQRLIDAVIATGANWQFLTAIPRRTSMPTAEEDKREWIKKYIGGYARVVIGPYSRDKWKHARPGDILIDDRQDNIHDWINKGFGIGIFHNGDVDATIETLNRHTITPRNPPEGVVKFTRWFKMGDHPAVLQDYVSGPCGDVDIDKYFIVDGMNFHSVERGDFILEMSDGRLMVHRE